MLLKSNEESDVTLGITNRERETVSYRVAVLVGGTPKQEFGPMVLVDGDTWQGGVSFEFAHPGKNQKVEFFLYHEGSNSPEDSLQLTVTVEQ